MVEHPTAPEDAFLEQIKEPVSEISVDLLESGLDSIIENPLLGEIPLVRSALAAYKIGGAIRERHFVRKLLLMLQKVSRGLADGLDVSEFRWMLEADADMRRRATEHILVLLDHIADEEKAAIVGELLLAHMAGEITWERFVDLTLCLDALHRRGYDAVVTLFQEGDHGRHVTRMAHEGLLYGAGIVTRHGSHLQLNELGVDLAKFGLCAYTSR